MKKILVSIFALICTAASGTTLPPVQMLSPAGSSAGQTIVSTGSTTAPGWATVPLSGLSSVAANTVIANSTGSTAAPTAFSMPSCSTSTSALQYTSGTGFACGSNFANLTGSVFTGVVKASYASPTILVNDTSGTGHAQFQFYNNNVNEWNLTNSSGVGNQFTLDRYVSGSYADSPISVSNSNGTVTMTDGITNSPISGSTGSFTTLAASSTVSGTGFSNYLASPPAIGGTTAAAGKFTTLQATGALTGFPGRLLNIQVFTATGTYTPTTGTNSVYVKVQGAGGAGGGTAATSTGQTAAGAGGSAGAYAEAYYTSGFSGVTVTVGAKGTGVSGSTGGAGTATSFGALVSCGGGAGGPAGAAASAFNVTGAGALTAACTGTFLFSIGGQVGIQGVNLSGTQALAGNGASSLLGIGGTGTWSASVGVAALGYGSAGAGAGAGASTAAQAGASGGPGVVIIFEFS